MSEDRFNKIIAHAREYGFVFPSSEIYDGLGAVYDYGQNGVELKNNIRSYWWNSMVRMHENIVGIDASIFMHPDVWKASGHISAFNDPLIDNKDSKKRYRADVLVEEYIEKIKNKADKEVARSRKRFGDKFDEDLYRKTNQKILKYNEQADEVHKRLKTLLQKNDLNGLKQLIEDLQIPCPISGTRNWTEVRQFNLMFETSIGSVSDEASKIYLRPETAQGIFVNFLNVQKTGRMKLPFGIAQTGKAFRNEIVARQFLFRMREFEQMEMQYFVQPGKEMKWYEYWKELRMKWHLAIGFDKSSYRFKDHIKLAHYAKAACDIEYNFPIGFKEVEGIHSRTDFDLRAHNQLSGKKLKYFDPDSEKSYVPYVIETSIGLDRTFLLVISAAFQQESLADGSERVVLKFPPALAPVKVAIFPLVKKDGLPELARSIFNDLRLDYNCYYEEKDTIGRRYRRQDAIGTPFCITIDHETVGTDTVTIRFRDTMKQERIPIKKLPEVLSCECNEQFLLKKLI